MCLCVWWGGKPEIRATKRGPGVVGVETSITWKLVSFYSYQSISAIPAVVI